jgi:sterol desaturase/sphingolipid hydroxylase (fatty acid hydroxylase superfamily)
MRSAAFTRRSLAGAHICDFPAGAAKLPIEPEGDEAMTDATVPHRNARGEWRPEKPIALPPTIAWPPRPMATAKWLFGFPGYLWPMNTLWLALTLLSWYALTPDLAAMREIEAWWIAVLFARNLALTTVLFGGLHLYFYVLKRQGDALKFNNQPLATGSKRFLFGDQVKDNALRTLGVGVPTVTAYEALTWWLFANGHIGFGIDPAAQPLLFWGWFAALLFLAPVIHALHFYAVHRVLHWKPLYRHVHSVHHLNVEVGPWSGLAMHPVEQILYFSTVVVQWLLAAHPVNALFQIHVALFSPALGHSGFERLLIGKRLGVDSGNYFHYLHHKYFECNYGGSLAPLDKLFGTFHDGSAEAQARMRARMRARHG